MQREHSSAHDQALERDSAMLVIFNPAEVVEDCSGCRLCWMRWSAACTLGIEGSLHAVCAAAALVGPADQTWCCSSDYPRGLVGTPGGEGEGAFPNGGFRIVEEGMASLRCWPKGDAAFR